MGIKSNFLLHLDQYEPIKGLTLEQKGELLDAFFLYNLGEHVSFSNPILEMAFAFFRQSFERDNERYERKCQKNKDNISKRYTNNTTVYDRIPPNTNTTDNDNDNDSDIIKSTPNGVLVASDADDECQPPAQQPPEAVPKVNGRIPDCPHQQIIALYHEILPEMPRVKIWEGARPKNLAARWKQVFTHKKIASPEQGVEYFRKLFTYIRGSPFLMGQTAKPFRCNLGWIVTADNYRKIVEENYHAKDH